MVPVMDIPENVARWGVAEISASGPNEGNPFEDASIRATFTHGEHSVAMHGFYDGDGTYRVRFMPDTEGVWHVRVEASFLPDAVCGSLRVTPASPGNLPAPLRSSQTHIAPRTTATSWGECRLCPRTTSCQNRSHAPTISFLHS